MTAPDDRTPLAPASLRSVAYYRDMAQACRRSGAVERAQAAHLDPDERHAAALKAGRLDEHADQWEALAAELEAFGDDRAADHPDQGALL